jgi:hypothetical protein
MKAHQLLAFLVMLALAACTFPSGPSATNTPFKPTQAGPTAPLQPAAATATSGQGVQALTILVQTAVAQTLQAPNAVATATAQQGAQALTIQVQTAVAQTMQAPQNTPTSQPTATPLPPTATSAVVAPIAVLPTATSTKTVMPAPSEIGAGPQYVKIYLIAINDNGKSGPKIGCNDSVLPVQVQISPTKGVLKAALTALLGLKDQYYGQSGLYNSLYQSSLQLKSVGIVSGKATIYLTGTLTQGGECDSPRVKAQLEYTALQFSTVKQVVIYLNNKLLNDVLSLK